MSDELFLIAHKVRNAPAFDVAIQMECPHCHGAAGPNHTFICVECEGEGFWWIVSTSGHRAYPYWSYLLERVINVMFLVDQPPTSIPPSLPDHYPRNPTPSRSRIDITGLLAPSPPVKIQRRF